MHAAHRAADALGASGPLLAAAAARLHELIDEASGEYSLFEAPSPQAVAMLGHALEEIACASVPEMRLTPTGAIWAEWRGEPGRNAILVIHADGAVRLGAVLCVRDQPRRPFQVDIEGDLEAVLERFATDPALAWLRRTTMSARCGGSEACDPMPQPPSGSTDTGVPTFAVGGA